MSRSIAGRTTGRLATVLPPPRRRCHLDRTASGRISPDVKFTFRKMHGLGNDFVVLDARNRATCA